MCRTSGTALDGFVLGDAEKEYLLTLIQRLSAVYFTEVLGFCLMGNPFHLLVRMLPEEAFSDAEVRTRFQRYYGADSERHLLDGQLPTLRAKSASLSEYVKELKQSFSLLVQHTPRPQRFLLGRALQERAGNQ